MAEPLFLKSQMHDKIWGELNFVMSLVMTFQQKQLVNTGQFQLIQTVFQS